MNDRNAGASAGEQGELPVDGGGSGTMTRDHLVHRLSAAQASVGRRWAPGAAVTQMLDDDANDNPNDNPASPRRGDHDLNDEGMRPNPPLRPAAVLVPLVERPDGFTVLLTQRSPDLRHHAGQISFPGGRVEEADGSAEATALREANEEIGLAYDKVECFGTLDIYETRTGFEIVPVVGIVTPPFEMRLEPGEVAEAFEVPLDFLLDPANHERHSRVFQGVRRQFHAMPYGERYIWGATAGMLVNLYEVLTSSDGA